MNANISPVSTDLMNATRYSFASIGVHVRFRNFFNNRRLTTMSTNPGCGGLVKATDHAHADGLRGRSAMRDLIREEYAVPAGAAPALEYRLQAGLSDLQIPHTTPAPFALAPNQYPDREGGDQLTQMSRGPKVRHRAN